RSAALDHLGHLLRRELGLAQGQRIAAVALVAGPVPLMAELAGRLGLEDILAVLDRARVLGRLGARGAGRCPRADRDDRNRRDPAKGTHRHRQRLGPQSPNTNSIDAVELFLSSGAKPTTNADCRDPPSTAMYCLPPAEKLTAGALMPVPTLKLHTCCSD